MRVGPWVGRLLEGAAGDHRTESARTHRPGVSRKIDKAADLVVVAYQDVMELVPTQGIQQCWGVRGDEGVDACPLRSLIDEVQESAGL